MKRITKSLLAILFASILFTSCNDYYVWISGEGDVVSKTLSVSEFEELSNVGDIDVVVVQGDTQKIVAVGQENIINRIDLSVSNQKWDVCFMPGRYRNYSLTIYVTVPELNSVRITGSGDVVIDSTFTGGEISLQITGSGNIYVKDTIYAETVNLDIVGSGSIDLIADAQSIISNIVGSGNIYISGNTFSQRVKIVGSGNYNGYDLSSQTCNVYVSGSGDSYVFVDEVLGINILGSGDVSYIGHPSMDVSISGSGIVTNNN